jgi:CRISPR-associated endoribonuclease Cas6
MNSPDLYAFVLRLQPQHKQAQQILGHHTQALFYELVSQIDPELSNVLHSNIQHKPFTVALLQQRMQEVGGQQNIPHIELRITLCQNQLFSTFTRALLKQQANSLRLAQTQLSLLEVLGTSQSHPFAGFSSFAQIAQQAQQQTAKSLGLRFLSPTAFSQGTRSNGKPRYALFPMPDLVFGSLSRRWNELCPPELSIQPEQLVAAIDETVVSMAEIKTRQFQHQQGKPMQKGFVGECFYELPKQPELAHVITQLIDAAFYLGLGIKTARSMGQVQRI